jgi:hypothetical protein
MSFVTEFGITREVAAIGLRRRGKPLTKHDLPGGILGAIDSCRLGRTPQVHCSPKGSRRIREGGRCCP